MKTIKQNYHYNFHAFIRNLRWFNPDWTDQEAKIHSYPERQKKVQVLQLCGVQLKTYCGSHFPGQRMYCSSYPHFLEWLRDSKTKPRLSQSRATQNTKFSILVTTLGEIIQWKLLEFAYLIQCCCEKIKTQKIKFYSHLQPWSSQGSLHSLEEKNACTYY